VIGSVEGLGGCYDLIESNLSFDACFNHKNLYFLLMSDRPCWDIFLLEN